MSLIDEILSKNLQFMMSVTPKLGSQYALAKVIPEVAQTTISRILRQETTARLDSLVALARAFNLQAHDLLDPDLANRLEGKPINPAVFGKLALVNWNAVTAYVDGLHENNDVRWVEAPIVDHPKVFFMTLTGQLMNPDYRDGEILQIDTRIEPKHLSDVIVSLDTGRVLFRRLQLIEGQQHLETLNDFSSSRIIPLPEHSRILGVCTSSWMRR